MKNTKAVKVGSVKIGGDNPVSIQSMLNAHHSDIAANVAQAAGLERSGCEILRVAVPTRESVALIPAIKNKITIPLVADIHFDYRLAVEAAAAGADKIRINPGNIGGKENVRKVVAACKPGNIPIRIGVNGGSLEKEILLRHGGATPAAMVESALYHASFLEEFDFDDIVISLKSSNVKNMVEAYRIMSQKCDYPLHLGVTEAGSSHMGLIRSSVGIGSLLLDGIGDTIRVTLTAPPEEEITAARDILKAVNMHKSGVTVISCPTCGRTSIDLFKLAAQVEDAVKDIEEKLTVAVMGCVVNGPGEAGDADVGICGGDNSAALFVKGAVVERLDENEIIPALLKQIDEIIRERRCAGAKI